MKQLAIEFGDINSTIPKIKMEQIIMQVNTHKVHKCIFIGGFIPLLFYEGDLSKCLFTRYIA